MSQAGALSSTGGGSSGVQTLTGNTGGAVGPSANINIVGSGTVTVTGNPGTSTLTISQSGAGVSSVTGTTNQISASPTTGAVVLSLVGPYTPATYTAHGVLVGEGTSSIVAISPDSTSGIPLISQGSSSNPAYGTAVVAGGGTGDTSFTAYAVLTGGTTSTAALQNVSGVGTSGQVLTSNGSGTLPTWQAAAGGTFYSITPYIVGSDSNSQYSTIQAAINQAVTDGASDSTPKNIYVKPGTYTETLTGNAGIRIIGLSVPAIGASSAVNPNLYVLWNGVCTWSSGAMEFENIRTTYNGSGTIFTIPGSGKLVLQGCQLNNTGGAGTIVADGGTNCQLFIDNCQPGLVGVLLNSTHTGFIGQISNCMGGITAGGSINTVGGTYTLTNVNMDAFWIMGNTEAYSFTSYNGIFNSQFRSSASNQSACSISCFNCTFISSNPIQSGKASIVIYGCVSTGATSTIVDDSEGPGSSTIIFIGGDYSTTSALTFLGSGSTYAAYGVSVNNGDFITNTTQLGTLTSRGYFSMPSVNGTPTGTPTIYGAATPMVFDTATNKLYAYNSGSSSWVSV